MKTIGKALLIGIVLIATSFVVLATPAYAQTIVSTVTLATPLDGISSVTADIIATHDQSITGVIDAAGYDIAVYVPPGVTGVTIGSSSISTEIYGATMVGVYADGTSRGPSATDVTVTDTSIYQIGNHASDGTYAPNGAQYGWDIVFAYGVTGIISGNNIYEYQKAGIVLLGSVDVSITDNTVTGNGPINYIAQNGIEVDYGASSTVRGNTITANEYTGGSWTAVGLLLYDVNPSMNFHSQNHYRDDQTNFYIYGTAHS
jgi:parallel beta-helix repeat protein